MAGKPIEIKGADALARKLKAHPAASAKEVRKANLIVSRKARDWSQSKARTGDARQRKMAGGIGAGATSKGAYLSVRNMARTPGAAATFMGTPQRTGWYALPRYANSSGQQHPTWVGNRWDVAKRGQGPYAINDALADHLQEIKEIYLRGQIDILTRAQGGQPA